MKDHVLKHVIFKRSNPSASCSETLGAEPAHRRAGARQVGTVAHWQRDHSLRIGLSAEQVTRIPALAAELGAEVSKQTADQGSCVNWSPALANSALPRRRFPWRRATWADASRSGMRWDSDEPSQPPREFTGRHIATGRTSRAPK